MQLKRALGQIDGVMGAALAGQYIAKNELRKRIIRIHVEATPCNLGSLLIAPGERQQIGADDAVGLREWVKFQRVLKFRERLGDSAGRA